MLAEGERSGDLPVGLARGDELQHLQLPRAQHLGAVTPPPALRIVEALLFLGGGPVKPESVCEAIRGFTPEQFADAVDTLNRNYRKQGRPYAIVPHGGMVWTGSLIAIGLVLTLPTFFQLFAPEE